MISRRPATIGWYVAWLPTRNGRRGVLVCFLNRGGSVCELVDDRIHVTSLDDPVFVGALFDGPYYFPSGARDALDRGIAVDVDAPLDAAPQPQPRGEERVDL